MLIKASWLEDQRLRLRLLVASHQGPARMAASTSNRDSP